MIHWIAAVFGVLVFIIGGVVLSLKQNKVAKELLQVHDKYKKDMHKADRSDVINKIKEEYEKERAPLISKKLEIEAIVEANPNSVSDAWNRAFRKGK